jgi:hypothetical protein
LPQGAAEVFLRESWSYSQSLGNRSGSALQGPRLKTIEQASEIYAQTKEHGFESKAAEEQARLLKYVLLPFNLTFLFCTVECSEPNFICLFTSGSVAIWSSVVLGPLHLMALETLTNESIMIAMMWHRLQQEFEISTGQPIFVDSSVSDTIRTLITLGNHRAAQKVRVEFKVCRFSNLVPNRQYFGLVRQLFLSCFFSEWMTFGLCCIEVPQKYMSPWSWA